MSKRHIRTIVVSAPIGVSVIFFAVSISSSDTSPSKLVSSNVEKVTPTPGRLQRPQAEVAFDLKDGFVGRISIDGEPVPDDQLEKVVSLGQYTFRPGKEKIIESFVAGTHNAEVFFWPADEAEPSTPQSYKWDFRVTS